MKNGEDIMEFLKEFADEFTDETDEYEEPNYTAAEEDSGIEVNDQLVEWIRTRYRKSLTTVTKRNALSREFLSTDLNDIISYTSALSDVYWCRELASRIGFTINDIDQDVTKRFDIGEVEAAVSQRLKLDAEIESVCNDIARINTRMANTGLMDRILDPFEYKDMVNELKDLQGRYSALTELKAKFNNEGGDNDD